MGKQEKLTRRRFLTRATILGCSAAASPFITPITLASAPWDTRLVVIILRGGMDGLDVIQPYGDRNLAQYRPTIHAGEAAGAADLDGFFALNKGLRDLLPMWQSQELAFVHAVSTPYRDKRSHFDGQDLLEAGTGPDMPAGSVRGGWLNRMLTRVPGATAQTAFAVGRSDMIVLSGEAEASNWSPDARLDLTAQGKALLDYMYHDYPMFQAAGAEAMELSQALDMGGIMAEGDEMSAEVEAMMMSASKASGAKALAQFAAERLNEDTRIAAFSVNGWDTHQGQVRALQPRLGELATALQTLRATLGSNWQKTAVIAMTEFGRSVRENGSGGTGHGTGGAMVLAGGAIRGGKIYGDWPGLGEGDLLKDRDLMATGDVRSTAAWVMRGMFGLERSDLEGHVFPGLDMGYDPKILA